MTLTSQEKLAILAEISRLMDILRKCGAMSDYTAKSIEDDLSLVKVKILKPAA